MRKPKARADLMVERDVKMTQEKDADAVKLTCTKCGHKWTVSRAEWIRLNLVTGKIPHCPKCSCGKILWGPIKDN